LGTKQPCSDLILQVPTRLLDIQYIFEALAWMAYVVRLIPVELILLSISVLGLCFYLLTVHHKSTATTSTQSLIESWQVFSCFSQLTSCFHTAIE
jgi:hypothetical protein